MNYHHLVKEAQKTGVWKEATMWKSVEAISDFMEELKEAHPEMFWSFMREQYGIMSGHHYVDEKWADHDVSKMEWKDKEGKVHHGAYWTMEQIEDAVKGKTFPSGVTKFDRFVAYNATASDLCSVLSEKEILDVAYAFWFYDLDWSENGSCMKIWQYMCCKYNL